MDRRNFLRRTLLASGVSMAIPLEALARQLGAGGEPLKPPGYGPLAPVRDEATGIPLLRLPAGFRYISYGWRGDALVGGMRTPEAHDGMGAIAGVSGRVYLVRNHEMNEGPAFSSPAYDAGAAGGTTILEFDTVTGRWLSARAGLAGTMRNCSGGATPWGTWLTCEETLLGPSASSGLMKKHGYVFEVPPLTKASVEPLVAMGRFVHEATAVDPATGYIYQTEDAHVAGLYRFRPRVPGVLSAGGSLEMLAIAGHRLYDTRTNQRAGEWLPIDWVPVDDPEKAHDTLGSTDGRGVFAQGWRNGGAAFGRLEGISYGAGKFYITATSGGDARFGQVWELDPAASAMRILFESAGAESLNMPDNVRVSPRGGLVLCEDGTTTPSVMGITTEGYLFRFMQNNAMLSGERNGIRGDFRFSEMSGTDFSPDGKWMFINMQHPGFTVAVTGPWQDGSI